MLVGTAAVVAPMLVGTAAAVTAAARCVLGGAEPRAVGQVPVPAAARGAVERAACGGGVTNSPVPKCFPPFQLPSPAQ